MRLAAVASLLTGLVLLIAQAGTSAPRAALFRDNFERGLSGWVGKNGGAHYGVVVADPLRAGNHVLKFTRLDSSGDIFSKEIPISRADAYKLKFDYLGVPGQGVPKNLGGTIGVSLATPGALRWLAGTDLSGDIERAPLADNGKWHTYTISFSPDDAEWVNGIASRPDSIKAVRIMIEDFQGAHGVAGDAYFDNISLSKCSTCGRADLRPRIPKPDFTTQGMTWWVTFAVTNLPVGTRVAFAYGLRHESRVAGKDHRAVSKLLSGLRFRARSRISIQMHKSGYRPCRAVVTVLVGKRKIAEDC